MGARSIEARLTARLLAFGGLVLAVVGIAAVALTYRVLDEADTTEAMGLAVGLREALARESRVEGDAPDEALHETADDARAEGTRSTLRIGTAHLGDVVERPNGQCDTEIEGGRAWRVCTTVDREIAATVALSIDAHRQAVTRLAKAMALVIAAALALLALAVRQALRAPVGEIRALAAWTARVADAEDRVPAPPATTSEIERLRSAFDVLVGRLLDALARERAVTAHIAHELRTPLAAMLAELDATPKADAAALERVRADARRLSDVIDAILVLSDRSSEHARAVVNVADVARALAPAGATIDAPDEALVEGDERLIALAIRNLIENAHKYAGDARLVRVTRDGDKIAVTVADEGPGVPSGERARMFDRYWRGSADGEGRGLGLALVRAVAERHGGEASATSGTGGRGLAVTLTLDHVVGWHAR